MPRLRLIALALLAAGAVAALIPSATAVGDRSPGPLHATLSLAIEGDAAAGQAVFLARCASCHGGAGQGSVLGPPLIGVGAAAADFELRTGRMPFGGPPGTQAVRKPPAFDDPTIRDLVAYVGSLGSGPAIPEPQVDTTSVSTGQRLFIANCAPCHGATARGGAVGGGALAPALDVASPVEVAEAMLIGPGEMPVFSGLSDSDRDAVVSYVVFLQTQPNPGGASIGGIGPVPEGFAGWILGLGLILVVVLVVGHDWRGQHA
jgi:ubiquinol-cytochrome c reductase cytochrome c subunit